MRGARLRGESGAMQYRIHEIAGGVAGERTSSSIRSVRAGSKRENQDARVRIAKSGDGLGPIFPVAIGLALFAPDALAILDKARTANAANDFTVQNFESRPHLYDSKLLRPRAPRPLLCVRECACVAAALQFFQRRHQRFRRRQFGGGPVHRFEPALCRNQPLRARLGFPISLFGSCTSGHTEYYLPCSTPCLPILHFPRLASLLN